MPYQGQPSQGVKALIDEMKGALWSTITDPTNGGTATAEATLEQHRVPDAARMLIGWRPVEYAADQAVAESMVSVFSIAGGNYNYQPQEVICGCIGDSILATGGILQQPSEYYDVFAPVSGGEQIDINIEPLDAIAGNRRASVELWWSDIRIPVPVIRSKCSREVATGTAAGAVSGTSLDITNTHQLIEVGGVISHAAHTVEEEAWASCKLICTGWKPIQTLKFLLEPAGAIADLTVDENTTLAILARRATRLFFKTDRATVTCEFDMDVALTNAGQLAHYLRWI